MNNHEIQTLINFLPNTAIVANGEFITHPILIDKLKKSTPIICCDGAIKNLLKYNITPTIIIGDCDSIPDELKSQFKVIKIDDQNSNDLSKALNYLKNQQIQEVLIYSASGLREDHSIANLAILYQAYTDFKHIYMVSNYGIFSVHQGNSSIPTIPKQQISFFTLDPNITISCQELKWPLSNMQFKALNMGTLNQATNDYIKIISDGKYIIYRAFEIKR